MNARAGADVGRTVARGFGQLLMTLGVVALLFCVWLLWGTGMVTSRAQASLTDELARSWSDGSADPAETAAPGARAAPPLGTAIARLHVPSLDEYEPWAVVEGVDVPALKRGPGHMPGTALPGQVGNVVLSGHRTTYGAPFNRWDELGAGDQVVLETMVHVHADWLPGRRADRGGRDATGPGATGRRSGRAAADDDDVRARVLGRRTHDRFGSSHVNAPAVRRSPARVVTAGRHSTLTPNCPDQDGLAGIHAREYIGEIPRGQPRAQAGHALGWQQHRLPEVGCQSGSAEPEAGAAARVRHASGAVSRETPRCRRPAGWLVMVNVALTARARARMVSIPPWPSLTVKSPPTPSSSTVNTTVSSRISDARAPASRSAGAAPQATRPSATTRTRPSASGPGPTSRARPQVTRPGTRP